MVHKKITVDEIRDLCKPRTDGGSNKIAAIKEFRRVTGMGLKDSKDAVERCGYSSTNPDLLVEEFIKHGGDNVEGVVEPLTKQEFMYIIDEAIDAMPTYHCKDMVECVEFLCKNIRANGGLDAIATEREKFLRNL